ncbi:amyloid-beta A4 precursor protein-binding family A member 3 isoform X2 [Lagopus leucura]|uniref:amyloid-beta A4 precursor protein-binding family A member 3 isoform X2 n=1 Tax=Lagopus leucura TaxID=30410 RepID=UPI001C6698F6|nr:amyloid-beta A4 precursor protein-binding family A member 3 isoform X2 [Lagopus leucura]
MESAMDFQPAPDLPAMDTEEGQRGASRPTAADGQLEGPTFSSTAVDQQRSPEPGLGPASAMNLNGGDEQSGLCRNSGREMEEEVVTTGPRGPTDWRPRAGSTSRDTGPPRTPSSGTMELDEAPEEEPSEMQGLLAQLETLSPSLCNAPDTAPVAGKRGYAECRGECQPCPLHVATGRGLAVHPCCAQHSARSRPCHGLLFAEADREDLLNLLCYEGEVPEANTETPLTRSELLTGTKLEMLQTPEERTAADGPGGLEERPSGGWICGDGLSEDKPTCEGSRDSSPEPAWAGLSPAVTPEKKRPPQSSVTNKESPSSCLAFKEVPGPCDPEDLLDGVIFGAKYLGSTQLVSERNPPTSVRMAQAQEAVDRIKAPEGESQPMTEVDLFVSTQRIKVLTADTQEAMMDHSLQTISYIADIGSLVVLMARRKLPRRAEAAEEKRLYKMICHVFHSADAQIIAQAIGQAFGVAYQRFLEANSIDPSELSPRQYSRALEDQEQHNAELTHFSRQENCKDVCIRKQKGEILGIAIVESGWGSILPTVVIANLMHGGPAERSGELSIGDRLMSINGTSLVGLPLTTCQSIIRELKHQTEVMLNIVHCSPVTTAVIRRPDSKYQLGFCVENGVICSLMRGGIAEKGGIRVGHRIIEINGQSVVATPHEKIIQILTQAVSEVHIKTMPASTYRLLTGQEQPVFL